MKQILIATHGKMASGIRYSAELIVGPSDQITTIDAYVDTSNIETQLENYFTQHANDTIFVLTDLVGGSVNQKIIPYSKKSNVTLISGMNLSILMQIMLADEEITKEELSQCISDAKEELQLIHIDSENKNQSSSTNMEQNFEIEKEVLNTSALPTSSKANITALRVDDRLIHGQVAMTWTKQLKIRGILVANDEAANDPTQKMALQMAAPSGIKVLIKPINEVIRILKNPELFQMKILVLTRTIKDALEIKKNCGEIGHLNIGNAGRFDNIDIAKKHMLSSTIMLTDYELENLKELVQLEPKTCMQQVPGSESKYVKDILEKFN